MTRTQAWRTVAEAFGTPPERRTERQQALVPPARFGLCYALKGVLCIHGDAVHRQLGRLRDAMGGGKSYWWPPSPHYDGERALFAGLLAAMTQRERDMLEPGL